MPSSPISWRAWKTPSASPWSPIAVAPSRRDRSRTPGPMTVLVAGKGHEDYQLVGDEVLSFDDRVVAAEELGARRLRAVRVRTRRKDSACASTQNKSRHLHRRPVPCRPHRRQRPHDGHHLGFAGSAPRLCWLYVALPGRARRRARVRGGRPARRRRGRAGHRWPLAILRPFGPGAGGRHHRGARHRLGHHRPGPGLALPFAGPRHRADRLGGQNHHQEPHPGRVRRLRQRGGHQGQ